MTWIVAIGLAASLVAYLVRRHLAAHGSGRLAQVAFRRRHGEHVARLLDGEVDPRPHSPWIAIMVDGRPARMVAAPVDGRLQAGIELFGREFRAQVWFTNGDLDELEVPEGVEAATLQELVARLRDADVVSCVHGTLRVNFDAVEELPGRLARVAPLLREFEELGRGDGGAAASGDDDGVLERN